MHALPIRVLFVCLGNICRSPMAEAIFQQLVVEAGLADQFAIESAGTGGWHIGDPPHPGTQDILRRHHVPLIPTSRAQQITSHDLAQIDYIITMDSSNTRDVRRLSGAHQGNVHQLLTLAPNSPTKDVPDPYYTGDFEQVYQLVRAGCQSLLAYIVHQRQLAR